MFAEAASIVVLGQVQRCFLDFMVLQKILDRLVSNLGPIYRTKGLGESVAGPVVALLGAGWPSGELATRSGAAKAH